MTDESTEQAAPVKRRRGRPRREFPPDIGDKIKELAGYGVPYKCIAGVVGMAESTLKEKFGGVLTKGHDSANAEVVKTLYQMAVGGDRACLMFWCKTQLQWREAERRIDLTSSDRSVGSPARGDRNVADDELCRLERRLGFDPPEQVWRAGMGWDEFEELSSRDRLDRLRRLYDLQNAAWPSGHFKP